MDFIFISEKGAFRMTEVLKLSPSTDGDGASVTRLMPTRALHFLDPFLLLDHFAVRPPAGFPPHPHRGFEIITYMLEGAFRHEDDAGHAGVIPTGGAQRITSGSGIWHSEMPATDGVNEGLQLWINLPRAEKGIAPGYQDVPSEAFPVRTEGGVTVKTIVGDGSPIEIKRPMRYEDIALEDGKQYRWTIPAGDQGFLYMLDASVRVELFGGPSDGRVLDVDRGSALIVRSGEASEMEIVALEPGKRARFVIAFGTPIGERPIFRGSYVD